MCKCEICGKEFNNIKIKANHIRWHHKPIENKLRFKEKAIKSLELRYNRDLGCLTEFEVICNKCNKKFKVIERAKKFPKKQKYYCSLSCANSKIYSAESKLKISKGIKKHYIDNNKLITYETKPELFHQCLECNNYIRLYRKYCDIHCKNNYMFKKKNIRQKYCVLSHFMFNLKNFSNEFNFNLIKQYGWYSASNKGNNKNGISRDHIYSVYDGMHNKINPLILAHPANCQLMNHNFNLLKSRKSNISLEDLLSKINDWDIKYGKYYNFNIDVFYINDEDLNKIYDIFKTLYKNNDINISFGLNPDIGTT